MQDNLNNGMIRILAWNIDKGGKKNRDLIADTIFLHNPDVIAFSEFRGSSLPLVATLEHAGYRHFSGTSTDGQNGVAVVSRLPFNTRSRHPSPPDLSRRWTDIDVSDCALGIGVLYIPHGFARPNGAIQKERFWDAVLDSARERINEPFLFVGDFNTGLNGEDGTGSDFVCTEKFSSLAECGYTDAWRAHNGRTEFTWYSGAGNGFRLDHAFVSPPLLPRVKRCWYSHVEREAGVSDHSILLIDVK